MVATWAIALQLGGLLLDVSGAVLLTWAHVVASKQGVHQMAGRDVIVQGARVYAMAGLVLLIIGFAAQALGVILGRIS